MNRPTLLALIEAARAMRAACVAHATAHTTPDPDYGELAKADKAAVKLFERLVAEALREATT